MHATGFLNFLVKNNLIKTVVIDNGWYEFDDYEDLINYKKITTKLKNFLLDLINFIKFKKVDSLKSVFCENKYIFEYIKPYINKKQIIKKSYLYLLKKLSLIQKCNSIYFFDKFF